MDKTLEIVMVVVALVISVVIVTGILQSQGNSFGDFASNQTESSNCGITINRLQSYCPDSGSSWSDQGAQNIASSSSCSNTAPSDVC